VVTRARTGRVRPCSSAVSTTARASDTTRASGSTGSSAAVTRTGSGAATLRIQTCPARRLPPRVVSTSTSGLGGAGLPMPASRTASHPLSAPCDPVIARPASAQSARLGSSGRVSTTPRASCRQHPRPISVRTRARLTPHLSAMDGVSTRGRLAGRMASSLVRARPGPPGPHRLCG
jgi:hypothetical protein